MGTNTSSLAYLTSFRFLPRVNALSRLAARDVGRGSETLMTFASGDLFRAARHLAVGKPARALVVTGFYIPQAEHPAAETDGPLGALEVCAALNAMGGESWLVTDEYCDAVIRPSARGVVPDDHVLTAPIGDKFDGWMNHVIDLANAERIDTLIYIERVGPARDGDPRNMRGMNIAQWTAPLSKLTAMQLHTIGVGDGGNEIGMGRVAEFAIAGVVDHGPDIACTVATDELVVAGTSNWGAHALVCAMHAMRHPELAPLLERGWHERALHRIVQHGGLDGVTMRNEASVDGLEPEIYYAGLERMSRLVRKHHGHGAHGLHRRESTMQQPDVSQLAVPMPAQ
ncbi:DUF4392 domain-containing protein [Bifidobacterium gallicum]|nr:DUF4392 domain-containing protein [Bifidobacterium gallicum]KFI59030.1 hypothetical protein BGLCM_0613 [Bifidobacterium gallicum DSM 20093 = LMG 11596]